MSDYQSFNSSEEDPTSLQTCKENNVRESEEFQRLLQPTQGLDTQTGFVYESPDIGGAVIGQKPDGSQWCLNSNSIVNRGKRQQEIFSTESLVNFKSPVVNKS